MGGRDLRMSPAARAGRWWGEAGARSCSRVVVVLFDLVR